MPADCNSFLDGVKNGFVFFSKSVTFLFLFCILNVQEPSGSSSHSCRPQGACKCRQCCFKPYSAFATSFLLPVLMHLLPGTLSTWLIFFAKKNPAVFSAGSFTLNGKSDCKFCCCFWCFLFLFFQNVSRKD